ncbi:MAG: hypothetical protein OXG81_02900 [Acidobacteria bacterium]|nr:hypothetical protein [Acidobacteriota bacterium]
MNEWEPLFKQIAEANDVVAKESTKKCEEPFTPQECMDLDVTQAKLQGIAYEVNEVAACASAQVGAWDLSDDLYDMARRNSDMSDSIYGLASRKGVYDAFMKAADELGYLPVEEEGWDFVDSWRGVCEGQTDTLLERFSTRYPNGQVPDP